MRLSNKELQEYRLKLSRVCKIQPVIYENGIFEFHNISDVDKNYIINILNNLPYVEFVNYTKSRLNFNKFNFKNGFPNPENLYTIRGNIKDDSDIYENIEIHDELNNKLWNENNELLPEVKDAIIKIVDKFKSDLDEDKVDLKIEDIYLVGSNANYNYTEDSDLDIHIIADESEDCSENHLPIIYNAYKTLFNNRYDINIKGINAEIYVESKDDTSNISTGVYSFKNGWIKKPTIEKIPKINYLELEKNVQKWEDKYLEIIKNPTIEKIENFISGIYDLRKDSVKERNEFAIGNLTFKEIRNLGYLQNLKDLKTQLENLNLSLK